jgi:hypothetical protein
MVTHPRRPPGKSAVQLRISLNDHRPTIWRLLLAPGEIKLSKLHSIFPAVMGWEGYHLHQFDIGDRTYGVPDPEFEAEEFDCIDEETVTLSRVVDESMRFSYLYDFGDGWEHEVVVERIEPVLQVLKSAVCIDGEGACPPEDCGGTGGFRELLDAITDPTHAMHDEYLHWIGRPFDPDRFSVAAANAALQRVR